MVLLIRQLIALSLLLPMIAVAQDQTHASQGMDVTASLVPEVQLAVNALDFGKFVAGETLPIATGYPDVIEVTGASDQRVQVAIDAGQSLGQDAQNPELRAMANGKGDFIAYRLGIHASTAEFGTGQAASDNPYTAGQTDVIRLDENGHAGVTIAVSFPTADGARRVADAAGFFEDTVTVTVLTDD